MPFIELRGDDSERFNGTREFEELKAPSQEKLATIKKTIRNHTLDAKTKKRVTNHLSRRLLKMPQNLGQALKIYSQKTTRKVSVAMAPLMHASQSKIFEERGEQQAISTLTHSFYEGRRVDQNG